MADTTTKRHPIRGFLWGILFGLGLAFVAIGQSWAALGTWPPFLLFLVGLVVGTVWATFGPARAPKGPAPAVAGMPADGATPPATGADAGDLPDAGAAADLSLDGEATGGDDDGPPD